MNDFFCKRQAISEHIIMARQELHKALEVINKDCKINKEYMISIMGDLSAVSQKLAEAQTKLETKKD